MSAETTAKVLTRMLENKPFRTQVADDPEVLAKLDLTDEERTLLVGTAKEGIDKLLAPGGAGGAGGSAEALSKYLGASRIGLSSQVKSDLTKAALERVARKTGMVLGHSM